MIGDVGCFSFHATKNIAMGEGGAIIVNNRKLISKAIYMSDNGIDRRNFLIGKEERYHWVGKGASYKASDINSAYRYYVSVEVMKKSYEHCKIGNVPAKEIEDLVIEEVKKLLQTPEVISQTYQETLLLDDNIDEQLFIRRKL